MLLLYRFSIFLYSIAIHAFSMFDSKAKAWLKGRENFTETLEKLRKHKGAVWFHCASLGEFEQARPLIEKLRNTKPNDKIVISFFSPSGYEVRKNFPLADAVFYLPLDTKSNMQQVMQALQPSLLVVVKYEFWYYLLYSAKSASVPVLLVSAIFRERQMFFRFYGTWFRKMLHLFTHIFVQDEKSFQLLKSIGISHCSVAGDTRFDRVFEIASSPIKLDWLMNFKQDKFLIVGGSTYKEEQEVLLSFALANVDVRLILCPHVISKENIESIKVLGGNQVALLSEIETRDIFSERILCVDSIGLLSSIYSVADMAFVGGGFGKGIHNVLEAAVFAVPIITGPNYLKFKEAVNLKNSGGLVAVNKANEAIAFMQKWFNEKEIAQELGKKNYDYVIQNKGATDKILEACKSLNVL
jgi:3-deoxy-D-manno-octulosonic-acid transferase